MRRTMQLTLGIAAAFAGACGGDGTSPSGDTTLQGTVASSAGVSDADAVVIWPLLSGGEETIYKLGEGKLRDGKLTVSVPAPPPEAALSDFDGTRAGIGFVTLVEQGTSIPDGIVEGSATDTLDASIVAAAAPVIVWRDGEVSGAIEWINGFPAGEYGCGRCAEGDGGFDQYVPTSCSGAEIRIGETASCNWS